MKDKLAVSYLQRAREILAEPDSWTKGVYARDSRGESIDPTSGGAVCYCLYGALRRSYLLAERQSGRQYAIAVRRLVAASAGQLGTGIALSTGGEKAVFSFNDAPSTRHADVTRALERAIEGEVG